MLNIPVRSHFVSVECWFLKLWTICKVVCALVNLHGQNRSCPTSQLLGVGVYRVKNQEHVPRFYFERELCLYFVRSMRNPLRTLRTYFLSTLLQPVLTNPVVPHVNRNGDLKMHREQTNNEISSRTPNDRLT